MTPIEGARIVLHRTMRTRHRLGLVALTVAASWLLAIGQAWAAVAILAVTALGAGYLVWLRRAWPEEAAPVLVSREGIFVRRNKVFDRADFVRAQVVTRRGDTEVVLHHKRLHAVTIAVRDEASGHRLVDALGLDVGSTAVWFPVQPVASYTPSWWMVAPVLAASMASFYRASLPLNLGVLLAVLLVPVLAVVGSVVPWRLRVGTDALVLERWGQQKVIALSDIEGVDVRGTMVRVRLHDKRVEAFEMSWVVGPFAEGWSHADSHRAWTDGLAGRIGAVLAKQHEGGHAVDTAALLQNGRSPASWRDDLLAMGAPRDGHYREAPLRVEDLWRVVEDGAQGAELRAAAAVALQPTLDDEGRTRLARTREASAETRVRMVLDAVKEGDPAELEVALRGMAKRR